MPSNKIYCGVGTIPKGKHRGSMKECIDAGQVRYYGVKKADPKLVETLDKKSKFSRDTLFTQIQTIKGKIKNLKNKMKKQNYKKN